MGSFVKNQSKTERIGITSILMNLIESLNEIMKILMYWSTKRIKLK